MTEYRAPSEQWAQCEEWARSQTIGASDACILELRSRVEVLEESTYENNESNHFCFKALVRRVEALESAQNYRQQDEDNERAHEAAPVRSLVERVALATSRCENFSDGMDEMANWAPEARAAIREVAAWFGERATPGTPQWIAAAELTDEVNQ